MRDESDCPRTLIVGAHLSENSGSGIYLGRLFSLWTAERLACVSSGSAVPDWRRCERFYQLGGQEYRLLTPLSRIVPAVSSGPRRASPDSASRLDSPISSSRESLGRCVARYSWRTLLWLLGGGEFLYDVGPSRALLDWLKPFRPEVLYGQCSHLNSIRFLCALRQSLRIPLVLHCMDDWPESLYRCNLPARLAGTRYRREFAALTRSADVTLAICKEMAEEYQRRYGIPVSWLFMPADLDPYRVTRRTQWAGCRPFRLRYGGRVGWAIRESLADLARAVHSLRQEGVDITFDIVKTNPGEVPAACRTSSGVFVKPPGPYSDVPREQAAADVLIVCYDFDDESVQSARYSMPSKLAECMAVGTPILVYAPAGLPVVEYARREGWGKIVDHRDPASLRTALIELMSSEEQREQFGRAAMRLAAQRHNARVVSESLRSLLKSLTAGNPSAHSPEG
jgi:glycosyltransferase involved in cell wall biosynthesis